MAYRKRNIHVLRRFAGFTLRISYTARNKMAAVKKSIQSNIKKKLTEEKRYKNFRLLLILADMRLDMLGMCIT